MGYEEIGAYRSGYSIRKKYITPTLVDAGWDINKQIREERYFTDGWIRVRSSVAKRDKRKVNDRLVKEFWRVFKEDFLYKLYMFANCELFCSLERLLNESTSY